jgi:PAS domain S-box-containing protein
LHFAPLSLLIFCELLLFLVERATPLPAWFHLLLISAAAAAILSLAAVFRKRERRVLTSLRDELTGMQHEVAKAARRYKSLLEGAGNAIFVSNAESGMLEEANRRGMELLGFSKEELSSMSARDLLHPAEHDKFRSFVYQLKRHGRSETEGMQFQRKDGSLFLGEINARLIDLGDEQVVHCILRDITEKRRNEKELWQRNRELSILNAILTGMSRGGQCAEAQQEALTEIMELFHAGGAVIHLIGDAGEPPEPWLSHQVSKRLEKLIAAYIAAAPDRYRSLRLLGEERSDPLLAEACGEGWWGLTSLPLIAGGDILIGVLHLVHPSPHSYSGPELRFLESVGNQMGNVIEKNRLFGELKWKSAELLRSHRLLEKTSHNLSVSEIRLKQNLTLVEQANLELSRMDRMKNHFLGMVSHEFNTPLTSIISGADHLLQQGGESPDRSEVLEMVRDGGLRLKELVADLLKLIRLEAHDDTLQTSAVHLKLFLENVTEQLRPQLEKRRQRVSFRELEKLPFFEGDRDYLERVFGELLSNAMKFSPEGGEIEVSGRVVDRESLLERRETLDRFNSGFLRRCGERCYLEVSVRDQGIGIPIDEQQGIFEIFYEVGEIRHHSSGQSRSQGKGAGLGLAMVKGMVEAHGGMVWVESAGGSAFYLLLPMEQESSQPALF